MKIVLTTLNAKYIHTNLAIRYLKAYAQPEFDVTLVEYTIKDPAINIVSDLVQKQPDVIGFSCYIWNIEETIKVIKMIKKINPEIKIIAGGPEVTYDVQEWMKEVPEFDFIVIGEGEQTFKQLLSALASGTDFSEVPGIAYRKNDIIQMNPQRNKLDLKELPSPYRFEADLPHLAKRVTYLETSRGARSAASFAFPRLKLGSGTSTGRRSRRISVT